MDVKTMEIKKTQPLTASVEGKEAPRSMWRIHDFVGEVKLELKRITWTTPDELKAYTKMVVLTTFIFGLGIYGVDILIQASLNLLGAIIRLIGG